MVFPLMADPPVSVEICIGCEIAGCACPGCDTPRNNAAGLAFKACAGSGGCGSVAAGASAGRATSLWMSTGEFDFEALSLSYRRHMCANRKRRQGHLQRPHGGAVLRSLLQCACKRRRGGGRKICRVTLSSRRRLSAPVLAAWQALPRCCVGQQRMHVALHMTGSLRRVGDAGRDHGKFSMWEHSCETLSPWLLELQSSAARLRSWRVRRTALMSYTKARCLDTKPCSSVLMLL